MKINEYELLYLARSQSMDAIEILKDSYLPFINKLYSFYGRYIYSADYEELKQIAYIGLYKAISHYRNDKNMAFHSFVIACMYHEVRNYVNEYQRHHYINQQYIISLDSCLQDEDGKYMDNISLSDYNADAAMVCVPKFILEETYDLFSGKEREIFVLKVQGYSNPEIASKLNISYKAVDNAWQRIRNKLTKTANIR